MQETTHIPPPAVYTGSLHGTVSKYLKIFTTNLKHRVAYVHDLIFSSIFMVLIIFIFLKLWQAVFISGGRETLCGYTLKDMIWYMVITESVVLSLPQANQELSEQVKSGHIACYLIRPMNLVLYHYCDYLSRAVLKLPVNFLVGAALAYGFVGPIAFPAHPVHLLAVLFLAVTLDFIIKMNIGILAFWMEETAPIYWIYQKLTFTLGGLMLPLDIFPDWLQRWCMNLPFRLIPYSVSKLFVSYSREMFTGTLVQFALWVTPFTLLLWFLYRKGVARINVHGG